jgi:hypothetical protein
MIPYKSYKLKIMINIREEKYEDIRHNMQARGCTMHIFSLFKSPI